MVVQFLPRYSSISLLDTPGTSLPWCTACVTQSLWIFAFCAEYSELSLALILSIVVPLGLLTMNQAKIVASNNISFLEKLLFTVPFAIHFSWVTAATAVSINIVGVD